MIFAVAACGSVYCTACSVFLCLLLVSDDSPLTEPSESTVARVAVGKFVASQCQAFVPVRCVWRGGCPWHIAAPLPPHSWKTTMIRVGGGGWWGSSPDSQLVEPEPFNMFLKILLNEAEQRERCIIQWACLTCTTFQRLFWGRQQKWSLVQSEDMILYSTLSSSSFSFLLTFPPSSCRDTAGRAMALSVS